jgi:hypothetical protein
LRPPPEEPMPSFADLPEVVLPAMDGAPSSAPTSPIEESELDEVPTVHAVVDESPPHGDGAKAESGGQPDDETPREDLDQTPPAAPDPVQPEPAPPAVVDPPPPEPTASVESVDDDDVWEDDDSASAPPARVTPLASPAPPGHLPERRVVVIDEDGGEPSPTEAGRAQPPASSPDLAPGPSHQPAVADIGATMRDEGDAPKRRWRLFRKGGE